MLCICEGTPLGHSKVQNFRKWPNFKANLRPVAKKARTWYLAYFISTSCTSENSNKKFVYLRCLVYRGILIFQIYTKYIRLWVPTLQNTQGKIVSKSIFAISKSCFRTNFVVYFVGRSRTTK